MTYTEPKKKRI